MTLCTTLQSFNKFHDTSNKKIIHVVKMDGYSIQLGYYFKISSNELYCEWGIKRKEKILKEKIK